MPRIPIDTLHVKHSNTIFGCIWSHGTTAPVMVVTALDGSVTISLNSGANSLGEWLDIGEKLTKDQVEDLCKGKEVKL
jgi:hypothetical protein